MKMRNNLIYRYLFCVVCTINTGLTADVPGAHYPPCRDQRALHILLTVDMVTSKTFPRFSSLPSVCNSFGHAKTSGPV